MKKRHGRTQVGVVAGILVLGAGVVGIGAYVFQLATSGGGGEVEAATAAPGASLEAIEESVATLMGEGEWQQAERVLAGAVKQWPREQSLRLRYAEVLQALREFEGALAQYQEALHIGPREASIEHRAGLAASSAGLKEAALTHLEAARQMDQHEPQHALHLGLVQFNAGLFDEARASLTLARELDPELAVAWGMLAQIALREDRREVAERYVARARELAPESVDWRVVEARIVVRDEPERAIELLGGLAPQTLTRRDVRTVLKSAYGASGNFEEAAEIFAQASDASPREGDLALEAADLLERAGQTERAIGYARRAAMVGTPSAERLLGRLEDRGG